MHRSLRFACLLALATATVGGGAASLRAQKQERGMMERIQHPDMSLAFHPANKRFGGRAGGSGIGEKSATTRPFLFGRSATLKSYRARGFAGSRGFASNTFAGRDRMAAVNTPAAGADRAFSTRDVAVREARDAGKSLPVRAARLPNFTPVGKRQGALDEQQRTRPMTIDEVRELLNKSR